MMGESMGTRRVHMTAANDHPTPTSVSAGIPLLEQLSVTTIHHQRWADRPLKAAALTSGMSASGCARLNDRFEGTGFPGLSTSACPRQRRRPQPYELRRQARWSAD